MFKIIILLLIYSNLAFSQTQIDALGKDRSSSILDTCLKIKQDSAKNFAFKEIVINENKLRIKRKIDRVEFNVSKSMASIGTDAYTLIGKAPNIKITNNQINMLGKGAVKVMIDDRLLILDGDELNSYLKSIPSENIAVIEIISNPPANFDAAGNYGLIRIITKKNRTKGFSALLSSALGQASYLNKNAAATLNYLKNKINLQFSLSGKKGAYGPVERYNVYYPTQTWMQNDSRKDDQNSVHGQLNIAYALNKKNIINCNLTSLQSKPDMREQITNNIYNASSKLDSQINTSAFTNANSY